MKRALVMLCVNTLIFIVIQVLLGTMKHYDDTCFLITVIGAGIVVALDTIIIQYWQD